MKTYIFLKNYKHNNKLYACIVDMVNRESFPSSLVNCPCSKFYNCKCVEVSEDCYIKIGLATN